MAKQARLSFTFPSKKEKSHFAQCPHFFCSLLPMRGDVVVADSEPENLLD